MKKQYIIPQAEIYRIILSGNCMLDVSVGNGMQDPDAGQMDFGDDVVATDAMPWMK